MRAVIFVCVALLAGCVSTGVIVKPEALDALKVGQTTEAEAVAALGKPTGVTAARGERYLSWVGGSAKPNAASYIPVAGAFVGRTTGTSSVVMLRFGSDGKLAEVTTTNASSEYRGPLAGGQ